MAKEANGASSSDRTGPVAGILFVVLQVGGWGLTLSAYPIATNDHDSFNYEAFFAQTGNRWRAATSSAR